ncbi:MAG TPA: MarC family protein [Chitinophagales bacterium]|nr:MarC family protein [Chitinophagales bacterium]HPR29758.1 MarC family protein [Chitinophagales bacterium]HQU40491.1 MarC family protein [Chitinophagales bacterium]HRX24855.1 MarC family protein [Chitinophagales bacterium]
MFDLSFNNILTVSLTLFAIIDVVGSVPAIITIKSKLEHFRPLNTTLFAGALMIAFLFAGDGFLKLIGLDVSSFAIAGSIVIFIIGLEMILGINLFKTNPDNGKSGSFVPIGFPLLAGSGTLTSLISLRAVYNVWEILVAILINLLLIYVVLRSTGMIERTLGKGGLETIKKFFGVILIAIAVKIFKENFLV